MFLISESREERTKKIRELADNDLAIAVIIAAADFEWTCRRCILALGISPTKKIREDKNLLAGATFNTYKDVWNKEVYPRVKKHIGDFMIYPKEAFKLRNKLVHGEYGSVSPDHGRKMLEDILTASQKLTDFAKDNKEPIYGRKIIRRKAR